MPEIIRITSEALQQTVRRLLPSQQGFGQDLQASNVITPIIDLTPTAEGSNLPTYIQVADGFGTSTNFAAINNTATVANTGGFWRVRGTAVVEPDATAVKQVFFRISTGLTNEVMWILEAQAGVSNTMFTEFELTYFLNSGHSLEAVSNDAKCIIAGSVRQVATLTGELINPTGFNPE